MVYFVKNTGSDILENNYSSRKYLRMHLFRCQLKYFFNNFFIRLNYHLLKPNYVIEKNVLRGIFNRQTKSSVIELV